MALKLDGTVVAWGYNSNGQATVPAGLGRVTAIAAGGWHTAALQSDGTLAVWGRKYEGQTRLPSGLSSVKALAAGPVNTVVLVGAPPR